MEFGSEYVYTYTDSEEESVSDEEFEAGIDAVSWYCIIRGWCLKTDLVGLLDVDVDEKYERRRGASLPASSISKDYYTII